MHEPSVLHAFTNVGFDGPGRRFPGFPKASGVRTNTLAPREAVQLTMAKGDLLSVEGGAPGQLLELVVFNEGGANMLSVLGLKENAQVNCDRFDSARFACWVSAHGGVQQAPSHRLGQAPDAVILRAELAVTVWVIRPVDAQDLIAGAVAGCVTVLHTPAATNGPLLPPLLGDTRDEFTVPRGTGIAYELRAGEFVQIIDVEGQQCSDFMALRADGLDRGEEWMIDSTATRSMVRRAYPGPGLLDKFFDREMRPLLNVVQDTCGRHDTFGLACTARGYEDRGFPGHVNCSDNMSNALGPYGVARRAAWPAINFFWNTWIDPNTHTF